MTAAPRSAGLSKAFGKTLLTTVGMTAVGFISSVVTARLLGPEGRGLMSAALLICTLAACVAQTGMASSYVYHYGAARSFPYLRLLLGSLFGVCLLACVLAWGGLQLSHEVQLHELAGLVLLLTATMASQTFFFSLAQLQSDLHFFNLLRFGMVFGNLVLLLPLFIWFRPVTFEQILVTQLLVLIGLTVAGAYWARKHKIWQLKEAGQGVALSQIVRYGVHQHGTTLLSIFLLNFDKVVLLNRSSIVEYGYYALAFSTSRLIGAVQDAVSVALFARFAGRDLHELREKVRTAFRLTFIPMLAMAALGAALSPWLMVVVYGPKFAAMTLPFAILLFECVIGGASWTLAQQFNASGQPGLVLVRQFVSVVPILIVVPFLPKENMYVYLALLMLCGAVLRLLMTLLLYVVKLKEPLPQFFPTARDYRMVRDMLSRPKALE